MKIHTINICKFLHNQHRIWWMTQGSQFGFWQEEEAPMMTKRFLAASNLTDEWDTSLELSSAWIFRFSFRWIWGEGFIYEDRVRCTVEITSRSLILVFLFFVFTSIHQFYRFLILLSVTDWLAEAGNPCLRNQTAHIHPGGDWGCCDLISINQTNLSNTDCFIGQVCRDGLLPLLPHQCDRAGEKK